MGNNMREKVFKRNQQVIINNRGTKGFGLIEKVMRRKDVLYYDVRDERGITFEGLTTDTSYPVFVDETLSTKLQNSKLTKMEN